MARCRSRLLVLVPLLVGVSLSLSRAFVAIGGASLPLRLHCKVETPLSVLALPSHRDSEASSSQLAASASGGEAMANSASSLSLAQRRTALWGGALLIAGGVAVPDPASAESTPNLRYTVKLYLEGLQNAADQLVFGIRPRIVKQEWPWLRDYLRADSYGNSKGYIDLAFALDRVVVGNEDFLEGSENANLKINSLLEKANQTVWGEDAQRQETLLQIWDDMSAIVSGVMTSVNNLVAEEKDLQGISSYIPLVVPKKEASEYKRSIDAYNARCTGILQSGVCIELPKDTTKTIAEYAQIGLALNPWTSGTCVDGKCRS